MKRYLHIGFSHGTQIPDYFKINNVINLAADDWLRYGTNWIVYTDKDINDWHQTLKPFIGNGNILIIKVDMTEKQGWLPRWMWDWLNKERS